jgi:hypothetical protein
MDTLTEAGCSIDFASRHLAEKYDLTWSTIQQIYYEKDLYSGGRKK